jgi:hypothetical protein
MVIVLVLCLAGVAVLMALTALGQRRRGAGVALTLAAGLAFPITWTAWYLRDESPRVRDQRV